MSVKRRIVLRTQVSGAVQPNNMATAQIEKMKKFIHGLRFMDEERIINH